MAPKKNKKSMVPHETRLTHCTHAMFCDIPSPPLWAASELLGLGQHAFHMERSLFESNVFQRLVKDGNDFYVTLSLKRCAKGMALIPVRDPDAEEQHREDQFFFNGGTWWRRPQHGSTGFSDFLRQFLTFLREDAVQVFGTCGGHVLMPWQAIVCRKQWDLVDAVFTPVWKQHKVAYRRFYCCDRSPDINGEAIRLKTSIMDQKVSEESIMDQKGFGGEGLTFQTSRLPIRHGFIQFGVECVSDSESCKSI